jgi:hypothetical protein
MKQTAGMQFLKWYNEYIKEYGCSPSEYDVNYFWKANYLPMEKQQIIDACNSNLNGFLTNGKDYYKHIFKEIEKL